MTWYREFISQDYGRVIYKHKKLPVYITDEFNFFDVWSLRKNSMGKRQVLFLMEICEDVQEDIRNYFLIRNFHIGQIVPLRLEQKLKNMAQVITF